MKEGRNTKCAVLFILTSKDLYSGFLTKKRVKNNGQAVHYGEGDSHPSCFGVAVDRFRLNVGLVAYGGSLEGTIRPSLIFVLIERLGKGNERDKYSIKKLI